MACFAGCCVNVARGEPGSIDEFANDRATSAVALLLYDWPIQTPAGASPAADGGPDRGLIPSPRMLESWSFSEPEEEPMIGAVRTLSSIVFVAGTVALASVLLNAQDKLPPKQSFQIALEQAKAGDSSAMLSVARAYAQGTGVARNAAEAVLWYRKAADAGNIDAMFELANAYSNGDGAPQNSAEAARLYASAAERGHVNATYNIGYCYEKGLGVTKDIGRAIPYYKKAAAQGHGRAMSQLGMCYMDGDGVSRDERQGLELIRKGAGLGDAVAQYNLGTVYAQGRGVAVDFNEAVKWFRLSADQGYAKAMFNLGVCYRRGRGVAVDTQAGLRWWVKAADAGDPVAMVNVGLMYATGSEGVPLDSAKGMGLLRKAVATKDEAAITSLRRNASNGVTAAQTALREAGLY